VGMRRGARLYGCQPYLSEDRYREKMRRGRIRVDDLEAVLQQSLGDEGETPIGPLCTRFQLRLAMLRYPLRIGTPEELRWFVAELDALRQLRLEAPPATRQAFVEETRHWVMRDLRGTSPTDRPSDRSVVRSKIVLADLIHRFGAASIEHWSEATWEAFSLQALWRVCRNGVHTKPPPPHHPHRFLRDRDLLLEVTGADSDILVNDVLIRFCAAFVDQGVAALPMPHRDQGFFRAFCALYRTVSGPGDQWQRGLAAELTRIAEAGLSPLESIQESLELLGVGPAEEAEFLTAKLLALRGWAGMIWHMETRSDRVPFPVAPGTLTEYLAIRLVLTRLATEYLGRTALGYSGSFRGLRDAARHRLHRRESSPVDVRAFLVFQLAQVLGWTPVQLSRLSPEHWNALVEEIEMFSALDRRWVFQQAFERRFRVQALDALALHKPAHAGWDRAPRFQAAFCIDAREESFRRHLEEVAPDVETLGLPGFFGVAIYYRGAADAYYTALCPIVVKPQHWVREDVVYSLEESNRRRASTRRVLGTASLRMHLGTRTFAGGALLTAGLGVLASIPLVARVLMPRLTARLRRTASRLVQPPEVTRLQLERSDPVAGPEGDHIGYTVEEMANVGERMLREIGLTSEFSRLVLFLGHGSFCVNNPHKSAYDCGACSGSPGAPNSRALSAILNDPRVRAILESRGLSIPRDTFFIGGMHNTAVDTITFFDLDQLPKSHIPDFESARSTLEEACQRNALERCRRFDSAPLDQSEEDALRHVENRSEDLAQPRPEFGNATNAMCFVGRRIRTRGLFLDRRTFMNSYDPTQDDAEGTILARILAAAVPVCEGINLTYFLSYTDPTGWACGTKLPHNVTSLLGVMDGAASDLRPGLPWQGVEIHEPLRCLFVIEASPETVLKIMERNEVIGRILRNGWAQVAVLDPHSSRIQVYRDGAFEDYVPEVRELPRAASSREWYRGWRDHLGFAEIDPTAGNGSEGV
ncbi:MAG TPA: DUF2309 domain-containing protein, partial [Planctomycetaceae bacterium]|nr:DUF2309 domain-containing protein [Planctomycetaceae bacterium]